MPRTLLARLFLLATGLFALTGQAALILHATLPAWQHPAIVLDTFAAVSCSFIRALKVPHRAVRWSGGPR
jgi:hypothetical protein